MAPMRTARSKPSSTRSTTRSESSTSKRICGWRAANAAIAGARWRVPKVAEQVSRSVPRGTIDAAATGDLGFLEIGQELHAALVERLAGFGERQPARRAVEEPRVEMRLELGDVARHRRHRHAEALGRAREAAGLDDVGEGGHGVEAIHRRIAIIAYFAIIYQS